MKKILFLFFITILSSFAFAQHMSVESFRYLENDLSARAAKVEDINNELCALIRLNTPERGFEFTGCNVEKTEQKTGEIWVFVSPGVKFITIKHRDFGVIINYPFPERINPGCVYELKLRTARITQIIEETTTEQYLIIESSTPDAKIFINDEYIGRNSVRKFLPITQEHSYKVEAQFYHPKSGNVKLKPEEKTTLQVDLDPAFGYLNIKTTPESGAEIEINGELQKEKTPFTSDKLKSGTYTLQAFKPMYKSEPQRVDITDGKTTEITINLIPTFANAEITCQDKEVEIYIDGEYKAKGSFKGQLAEGSHQLELKKKSHRTIKKTINAISGQPLKENIANLQAINGKLNIDSEPFNADIYIDGKHYGKTPMLISNLLIGEHEVVLKKDGFKDFTDKITIQESKTAQQTFTLQEKLKGSELKIIKSSNRNSSSLNSVAYSPDGKYVVKGLSDGTIKIFDVTTEELLLNFKGHKNSVYFVAYSPDGKYIVSASLDKTIRIWDTINGKLLESLQEYDNDMFSVSYGIDGNSIITTYWDSIINVIEEK